NSLTMDLNIVKLKEVFHLKLSFLTGTRVNNASTPLVERLPAFVTTLLKPELVGVGTAKIRFRVSRLYTEASNPMRPWKKDSSVPNSYSRVYSGCKDSLPALLLRVYPANPLNGKLTNVDVNPSVAEDFP